MRARRAENATGMSTKSREVIWGGRIMGAEKNRLANSHSLWKVGTVRQLDEVRGRPSSDRPV